MLFSSFKRSTSSLFFFGLILCSSQQLSAQSELKSNLKPAKILPMAAQAIIADTWIQNQTIFAVGERGHIFKSTDGKQFTQLASPADQYLTAITGDNQKTLWAVGHDSLVLTSSDNGLNWKASYLDMAAESPLFDVIYVGNKTVIAVGAYGYTIRSTDNGITWNRIRIDVKIDEYEEVEDSEPHYFAVRALPSGNLIIACEFGKLAEISPEGEVIKQIETGIDSSLFGIELLEDQNFLIYGLRGRVFVGNASDGFIQIKNQKSSSIFGSFKLNSSVYLTGADGTLLQFNQGQLKDLSLAERIIITTGIVLEKENQILLGSTNGFRMIGASQ